MNVVIIFDDTVKKNDVIIDIIGDKGFADVVVKDKTLEDYYKDTLGKIYPAAKWRRINSVFEFAGLSQELINEETRVLHCFSNYRIVDEEKALLSFEKLEYIEEPFRVISSSEGGVKPIAAMFPDLEAYISFCRSVGTAGTVDAVRNIKNSLPIEGFIDIGTVRNFIHCITGTLDARYFNSLKGNEHIIIKSSNNVKKIKSEYCFYHLLPEDMRIWFVMPFNYHEENGSASYTMERLHIADLAIKWVHGSMDADEFDKLIDKYFYFINNRHKRTEKEYDAIAKKLYVDKVSERIDTLKGLPQYKPIEKILNAFSITLDSLSKKYLQLKNKIEAKNHYPQISVIGHGDLCFANTLYNKSTQTLKLIDPKGALVEEELWTNPYYDIAKLSHSVCGRYDFFNHGLFDFKIDETFSLSLKIPFDNSQYISIFKDKIEKNGFDYLSVRIYEVSLFLSMLPLHIDNPYKVLGFILNANDILKEIENVV